MKVPPKRKGNLVLAWVRSALPSLNESPSEKEGKFAIGFEEQHFFLPLNESPSEKEGKFHDESF